MASNHKRNVDGMHNAARCAATTAKNDPCRSPAVKGKRHCHVHGGGRSKRPSRSRKSGDYSKAALARDNQISREIKKLDRLIAQAEQSGFEPEIIENMEAIRRRLLDITQTKEAEFAASYVASGVQRKAKREAEAVLTYYSSHYTPARPQTPEMVRSRARGAILGQAVGEAVGITLEGQKRDSYRKISDIMGGGVFGLKPGEWGRDTATALALLDSLIIRRGLDESNLMDKLIDWQEEGAYSCTRTCVGIDKVTEEALALYCETEYPVAGMQHPDYVDNGSLVRVAPVAIYYWRDPAALCDAAARQSRTTHASPVAVDACVALAAVLADAINGLARDDVLRPRFVPADDAIEAVMSGYWQRRRRDEIKSNNNVANSLEAALWCVGKTDNFRDAVLLAANLGHDAGSTAALTGMLAGALYGAHAIPAEWRERLKWHDYITRKVDVLFKQSRPY